MMRVKAKEKMEGSLAALGCTIYLSSAPFAVRVHVVARPFTGNSILELGEENRTQSFANAK